MENRQKTKTMTLRICLSALFLAINVAMSSFGVPVPGGHLYLNDVIICTAAILLGPVEAFCVGGIGAFLGDLFFYPTPMFVSLVTHGLQAVVISLCAHKLSQKHPRWPQGSVSALARSSWWSAIRSGGHLSTAHRSMRC